LCLKEFVLFAKRVAGEQGQNNNFFPPGARLGMVLGLIKIVANSGRKIEVARISQELQTVVD